MALLAALVPRGAPDVRRPQARTGSADNKAMVITSSPTVDAAVSQASGSTPGTVGGAASVMVLRKAMDVQAEGAAALIAALPQAPALATEGSLGRNINTYA